MKSTNLLTYQSDFFIRTLGVYLNLRNKISKIILTEYPYHVAGNQYLGLNVEYRLPLNTELTDDEINACRFWDGDLEIYLGRHDIERDVKSNADKEIKNLINLFDRFCDNVEINPVDKEVDRETIGLRGLLVMINFKKLPTNFPFN